MKKSYVKPVLNSSMEGTLEGVYAYGNVMAGTYGLQCTKKTSKNEGGEKHGCYVEYYVLTWCGIYSVSYCEYVNYWGPKWTIKHSY
ncbi:hypothetical protein [Butyrivibrio sp. JL13D10]|uniref:hypothetical protein n=1 Tax=Butyrivibrio sp. JL13D10 TaxID=3236815 RepID=UPI0038B4F57D